MTRESWKENGFHQITKGQGAAQKCIINQRQGGQETPLKKDKNDWAERVAEEAQKAAEQGHLKAVYHATRKLSAKKGKSIDMIKSKEGVLLTKEDEVLNRPAPEDTGSLMMRMWFLNLKQLLTLMYQQRLKSKQPLGRWRRESLGSW